MSNVLLLTERDEEHHNVATRPAHVAGSRDEREAEQWLFLTLIASLLSMVLKSGTFAASVLIKMHLRPNSITIVFEENS